ncbi:MAG: hypothetical protein ACR2NO_08730 [Chloroflexota bacterium]
MPARVCTDCGGAVADAQPPYQDLCIRCGGTRETVQLVSVELGLPIFGPRGGRIHMVEQHGRVRVMLEIGQDDTAEVLRDAIPLAIQWRRLLKECQGAPAAVGGSTELLALLDVMQSSGNKSYQDIADRINVRVTALLRTWWEFRRDTQDGVTQYIDAPADVELLLRDLVSYRNILLSEGEPDAESGPVDRRQFALAHARGLLEIVLPTQKAASQVIADAQNRLAGGKSPFGPGYPVSGPRIRELLRHWRQKGAAIT